MNAGTRPRPALALLSAERPLVIAHRGYSALAPENTLPAFNLAIEAGADLVELDYRHTRDRVPVVIHDQTLDRTTDARRRWRRKRIQVRATRVSDLQKLDAGGWFDTHFSGTRIPLLREALDYICRQDGVPVIEHKSGAPEDCARLLRERDWINRVIVMSFDWAYLRVFHALQPDQVLGALGPPVRLASGRRPTPGRKKLETRWLDRISKTGSRIVIWNRRVSRASVAVAHDRHLRVWIYTVNTPKLATHLTEQGVDGIITNHVGLIRQANLGKAGIAPPDFRSDPFA